MPHDLVPASPPTPVIGVGFPAFTFKAVPPQIEEEIGRKMLLSVVNDASTIRARLHGTGRGTESEVSTNYMRLLALLSDRGPMERIQARQHLDLPEDRFAVAARFAMDRRQITSQKNRKGHAVYTITDAGRRVIGTDRDPESRLRALVEKARPFASPETH